MELEQIPSDSTEVMTEKWHRLFNAAGCNPMCHCCYKMIPVGASFKLATIRKVTIANNIWAAHRLQVIENPEIKDDNVTDQTKEVMLCEYCTSEMFQEKQLSTAKEDLKARELHKSSGGGCFRIGGKITV